MLLQFMSYKDFYFLGSHTVHSHASMDYLTLFLDPIYRCHWNKAIRQDLPQSSMPFWRDCAAWVYSVPVKIAIEMKTWFLAQRHRYLNAQGQRWCLSTHWILYWGVLSKFLLVFPCCVWVQGSPGGTGVSWSDWAQLIREHFIAGNRDW